MGRHREAPDGFCCPYRDHCPHLYGLSTHWTWHRYQEASLIQEDYWKMRNDYEQQLDGHEKQICYLEKENAELKAQLQALHQKQFKANAKPKTSTVANSSEKIGKKRGAPVGHQGWFRKKPKHVDRTVEVPAPQECPDCASPSLQSVSQRWEHLQEDIILQPRAHVTRFDHAQAYCSCCDKNVVAVAEGEILNAPIGPVAKATASYLRFSLGLPYRKIQMLFETLFGLKFVPASAFGFDRMAAIKGQALYEDLRQKIQNSSVIYADETHWRVDGINHFLWFAGNKDLAYYQIDRHRSTEVAESILGEHFDGVLVCDSYAVYQAIEYKARQACLAHYLGSCKEMIQKLDQFKEQGLSDDPQARSFTRKLVVLFKEICAFAKTPFSLRSPKKVHASLKSWTKQLRQLCSKPLNFQDAETFRKRLIKEKDHWSTFLRFDNVDPTNNLAERSLRPSVIFRKITFGNRSDTGASIHSILSSLIQTALRQEVDPITFLQKLILKDTHLAQQALYNNSS